MAKMTLTGFGVTWGFASKKDPRFKGSGEAGSISEAHRLIDEAVLAIEKKLGKDAPHDIETWGHKS